jgi:predicted nucleotidyltransferase component of viral defense system
VAGGYAIKAHGLVDRPSDDVDFATASMVPLAEIVEALAEAYRRAGFGVTVRRGDARKGHLDVRLPSTMVYRVDVLKEPLNLPPTLMAFGPVLALRDAVALKLGALHDRALPRDMIDVHAASRHFSEGEMVALCRSVLDEDFSMDALRERLDRVLLYSDEEFEHYGCAADEIAGIRIWAQAWSNRLALEVAQDQPWVDEVDGDGE